MTTTNADSQSAGQNGRAGADVVLATGKVAGLNKGACLSQLDGAGWGKWQAHLKSRNWPPSLAKLTGARGWDALHWGLPGGAPADETAALLSELRSLRGKRNAAHRADVAALLDAWLAERLERAGDVQLAVECLAWCHSLPKLAAVAAPPRWCELVVALLDISDAAAAIDVERQPLAHQLLAGELAYSLGCLLPEVVACRQRAKRGRAALRRGAAALLDGDGQPAGEHLSAARGLLACWTRCALLGEHAAKPCFHADSRMLYEWFVRQSLRLARADGGQMLGEAGDAADRALFEAALSAGGDATDHKLAKLTLPSRNGEKAKTNGLVEKRLPPAAANSEWAASAILRCSWRRQSPRLLVDYSGHGMRTELFVDRHVVWSGDCTPAVSVDGQPLPADTSWQEVCWHSDEDVDYLELETDLASDWKLQRQFLLAREDRILFMADALLGEQSGAIEYNCRWPIANDLQIQMESESTECALATAKKSLARVLPLALPEWKCDGRRAGALGEADGQLVYSLRQTGARLYAPLWFDLDPARMKYGYTWRPLTVGENLAPAPPDVAVGCRVQLRLDQWIVYRSLAPQASRTLLGQNYFHEFVCGRFDRFGEVEPLVEVE